MEHFLAREMCMRMSSPRIRMHNPIKPLGASSADFKIMQYKAAARSQRTVRFANGKSPCIAIEMMAAISNENAI